MRILVAGGAGFIGSHLVRELAKQGDSVVVVDNFSSGTRSNLVGVDDVRVLEADICAELPDIGVVDAIFHLACLASPEHYVRNQVATLDAETLGTKSLLMLAERYDAKLVLASTSEVYGDPLEHPQRESYWGNVNPIGMRSMYDEGKRCAEAYTMAYHRENGVRTAIARIFNTYGPRMQSGDGRAVPNFVTQALNGASLYIYGDGQRTRSLCYASDLVRGLISLLNCDHSEPINLGNPNEISMNDLALLIIRMCDSSSKIEHVAALPDDPRRRRPDVSKANQVLQWVPEVALEDGLALTIDWFRSSKDND